MKCYSDVQLLALNHERMLESRKEEMEGHIMDCPRCTDKYRLIRDLKEQVQAVSKRSVPPHPEPAEFLDYLENRRKGEHPLHVHFGRCDECLQILIELPGVGDEKVSESLRSRVRSLNLTAEERSKREKRMFVMVIGAALAAAAVILGLVVLLAPSGGSQRPRRKPLVKEPEPKPAAPKPALPKKPEEKEPGPAPEPEPEPEPIPEPEPQPKPKPEPEPPAEEKPDPPPPPPPKRVAEKPEGVDVEILAGSLQQSRGKRKFRRNGAFRVEPGDWLTLPLRDRAYLSIDEKIRIVVDEGSILSMHRTSAGVGVRLDVGRLFVEASAPVAVQTRSGAVTAPEGEFAVMLLSQTTRLVVFKGGARFENDAGPVEVGAGQETSAFEFGRARRPQSILSPAKIRGWVEPARTPPGVPAMESFESGRSGPRGLVVTAPDADAITRPLAVGIARRLESALVIARGYGDYAVDSPTRAGAETEESRQVFDRFMARVRMTGGAGERVRLIVALRRTESSGVAVATFGIDAATARQLRDLWAKLCADAGIRDPVPLMIDVIETEQDLAALGTLQKASGCLSGKYIEHGMVVFLSDLDAAQYLGVLSDWVQFASKWLR